MARSFTVAQLMQRVRDEADMHGAFIADAELMRYISAAYAELHGLLVFSGLAYFESSTTITTSGAAEYAMPSDFAGIVTVAYQVQASPERWEQLAVVQPQGEFQLQLSSPTRALGYRVIGSSLALFPTPPTGQTYRVRYTPAPADLVATSDTIDGISGWEEYVVVEAAIKCLAKEGDTEAMPTWLKRKADLRERIEAERELRNLGQARRVMDVTSNAVDADDPHRRSRRWEDWYL